MKVIVPRIEPKASHLNEGRQAIDEEAVIAGVHDRNAIAGAAGNKNSEDDDTGFSTFLAFLGLGRGTQQADYYYSANGENNTAADDDRHDKELAAFLAWLGKSALDASGLAPAPAAAAGYNFFGNFGTLHPTLQQIDSRAASGVQDLLRNVLPDGQNPVKAWCANLGAIRDRDVRTWIPDDDGPAFYVPTGNAAASDGKSSYAVISYSDLQRMISGVNSFSSRPGKEEVVGKDQQLTIVAVLLPSRLMTDTALAILAIMSDPNAAAAPLESDMTPNEVHAALDQLGCGAIVTTRDLWEKCEPTLAEKGIAGEIKDVRFVDEFRDAKEGMRWASYRREESSGLAVLAGNDSEKGAPGEEDVAPKLLLRTSGTTSKPKVVPITGHAMLYNGVCFASGLGLRRSDVKLNALPLYHIGGWNSLMAVLVSGSSIIVR